MPAPYADLRRHRITFCVACPINSNGRNESRYVNQRNKSSRRVYRKNGSMPRYPDRLKAFRTEQLAVVHQHRRKTRTASRSGSIYQPESECLQRRSEPPFESLLYPPPRRTRRAILHSRLCGIRHFDRLVIQQAKLRRPKEVARAAAPRALSLLVLRRNRRKNLRHARASAIRTRLLWASTIGQALHASLHQRNCCEGRRGVYLQIILQSDARSGICELVDHNDVERLIPLALERSTAALGA